MMKTNKKQITEIMIAITICHCKAILVKDANIAAAQPTAMQNAMDVPLINSTTNKTMATTSHQNHADEIISIIKL